MASHAHSTKTLMHIATFPFEEISNPIEDTRGSLINSSYLMETIDEVLDRARTTVGRDGFVANPTWISGRLERVQQLVWLLLEEHARTLKSIDHCEDVTRQHVIYETIAA